MRLSLLLVLFAGNAAAATILIGGNGLIIVCDGLSVVKYTDAVIVNCKTQGYKLKIWNHDCPNPKLGQPTAGNYVLACT